MSDVRSALIALVKKLDEIGENKSFQGLWSYAFVHGYRYDGPTYESELEAARAALNGTETKQTADMSRGKHL